MFAVQAEGAEIRTVEGLADGDALHPLQQAFWEHHGLQCGFCTPGFLMLAAGVLEADPRDRRRGASRRAVLEPLPLHRLSEHPEGGARRGGRDEGMVLGQIDKAARGPPAADRQRQVRGRHRLSGPAAHAGRALAGRLRAAARRSRRARRWRMAGVAAVWTGADVAAIPPIDFRQVRVPGLEPYRQPILAQDVRALCRRAARRGVRRRSLPRRGCRRAGVRRDRRAGAVPRRHRPSPARSCRA